MYKMVVTVVKDTELGRVKLQYYFKEPVDAANFYQRLESQSEVAYINIRATSDEKQEA